MKSQKMERIQNHLIKRERILLLVLCGWQKPLRWKKMEGQGSSCIWLLLFCMLSSQLSLTEVKLSLHFDDVIWRNSGSLLTHINYAHLNFSVFWLFFSPTNNILITILSAGWFNILAGQKCRIVNFVDSFCWLLLSFFPGWAKQ